ncbi:MULTISPECIES: hypothetical protein [Methylobacter]|uniref:hypothetical protein n=1 Tax=Methylobacter TaxID=429 RepID=UPI000379C401|nr:MULTISPECIES: hypothetical protein [Methylobacter]
MKVCLVLLALLSTSAYAQVYKCAPGQYQQDPCPHKPGIRPMVINDIPRQQQIAAQQRWAIKKEEIEREDAAKAEAWDRERAFRIEEAKVAAAWFQADAVQRAAQALEVRNEIEIYKIEPWRWTYYPGYFY